MSELSSSNSARHLTALNDWIAIGLHSALGRAWFNDVPERSIDPALVLAQLNQDLVGLEAYTQKVHQWLDGHHHVVTWASELYPFLLRDIPDPPPVLYVLGDVEILRQTQLAMVGSRNPTPAGKDNALQFAASLAEMGIVITSGLALGIDAAAHEGALRAKGRTIAVAGTGVDRVYPAQHRKLAHQIVAEGGAIISEYPLAAPPLKHQFPRRNRLISGLSLGTLVVEAAQSSGSLITARLAMEQGREVFAIPGSIHNPLAKGCHQLIRQGAKLVETAQDILEELGALLPLHAQVLMSSSGKQHDSISNQAFVPDVDHEQVLNAMGYEPADPDVLVQRTGLPIEHIASMLLTLELNDVILSVPGGYQRRR